jgi:hypothetical protein
MDSTPAQFVPESMPPQPSRGKGTGRSNLLVASLIVVALLFLAGIVALIFFYPRPAEPVPPTPLAAIEPTLAATLTPSPTLTPPGPEVTEVPVIIPDTTVVLSGATIDSLASVSEDGSVYTFSATNPELEAVAPGDVIVGDVSGRMPDGFLRKVTNVSAGGGEVVLETEAATLEDAIDTGTVQLDTLLEPQDLRAGTYLPGVGLASLVPMRAPAAFVVNLDEVVLLDLDGDEATTDDQVRANGMLSLEPRLDFTLRIKGFRLEEVSLIASATERVELEVSGAMNVQFLDLSQEVNVARYYFQPITTWVGWVPVVISPILDVRVGLDGTASVSFYTGVTQQLTLRAGLRYLRGSFQPIADLTNDFHFTPPILTANAQLRGYAGLQFGLLIYGVGGPQVALDGFLELDGNLNRSPWLALYGGLRVEVGFRFEILGYRLADHHQTVLDKKVLLASSDARPSATPTATPTLTRTPAPTSTPTPTPTLTPTLTPRPACAFEAQGTFATLWQAYDEQLGCPLYPTPQPISDAEQTFDQGHMFWRLDSDVIYVVYEQGALSGTYRAFADMWQEGDPAYSCQATPPSSREQPVRGFGAVWCQLGGPDAAIGWGLGPEAGFGPGSGDPLVQDFEGGVILRDSDGTANGLAYVLISSSGRAVRERY